MKLFLTLVVAMGAIASPRSVRAQYLEEAPDRAVALDIERDAASDVGGASLSRGTPWGAALVGGIGAAGGSILLTYGIGRGVSANCPRDESGFEEVRDGAFSCSARTLGLTISMSTAVFPATIAGGVVLAGRLAGGHGRYDLTLLGATLGTGVGWAFLAGMAATYNEAAAVVGVVGFPLMQIAGALIGYHLSHRAEARVRERQFGPTLTPMRRGAVAGLSGRF